MLMILPLPKKHPIIAGKIAAEQQQQTTTQKKDTIIHHQAPLTDERCNYDVMIEYVTIRKLKG